MDSGEGVSGLEMRLWMAAPSRTVLLGLPRRSRPMYSGRLTARGLAGVLPLPWQRPRRGWCCAPGTHGETGLGGARLFKAGCS